MKYFISLLACLFGLLFAGLVNAVDEQDLRGRYQGDITEYYNKSGKSGAIIRENAIEISYRVFNEACGDVSLIIVPGWSEPKMKYAELIYDLRAYNYCIYILDHRSQGESSRLLSNSQITYVDDFNDYVNDLQAFDKQVVRKKRTDKVFILAHSMGGLVATAYVARNAQPVAGLILNAPMFQVDTGILSESMAYWISGVFIASGKAQAFVPGHGEWKPTLFKNNRQTHSEIRFNLGESLFLKHPDWIVSGVSHQWLRTSIQTTQQVEYFAEKIRLPVLLLQASEDSFVKPERQNQFCIIAVDCTKVFFSGAKHELLMEVDSLRDNAIDTITDFISQHSVAN